ncbi:MAG: arylsulfatase, partial [Planctomycetota bacterium]
GIRLTACYAAAPVCSSSRAGLMTGRNPSRVGVYDWIPSGHVVHLPRTEITVATLLQRAGYDTAHCGKWHLNGRFNKPDQPQPNDHGFRYWFSTQNNAAPSHENPTNFVRNGKPVGPLKGYSCQLVADEAIHWLKSVRDDSRPFFLFVCFHEPHEPVASPPELVARYRDVARNEDEAQYFANVTNMDAAVGRIIEALDELKLADSTIVWFTSDNGPETLNRYRGARRSYGSPGPLRGMKLWLYEGGIRVPGIIRWPGHAPANAQTGVPVCGLDVLPTFCELAGVQPPRDRVLDGVSMADLFRKSALRRTRPIFWHYYAALGKPKAAMRYGPWTLLAHRVAPDLKPGRNVDRRSMQVIKQARLGEFELYNLLDDLGQKNDLAAAHPERVRELAEQLVRWHREIQREGPDWYADSPASER